jgi:phosphorylcholine metabolism protein LicD
MSGKKESAAKLNETLLFIIRLLNVNNVNNWFVCYGTLLGMIREKSCIDQDDDIDIILDQNNYDKVKKILTDNKFTIWQTDNTKRKILKTCDNNQYASIDIYMAEFQNDYVFDEWNNLKIMDCYLDKNKHTFIETSYNGEKIYYPNNYERILANRYGNDWRIKKQVKIPQTMNTL